MEKPQIVCDLNTKTWFNLEEAIAYLGYGSRKQFQIWREEGVLTFYQKNKNITYKRTDLDRFMERYRHAAFVK